MSCHSPPATENCPLNVVVRVTSYHPSNAYSAVISSDGYGAPAVDVVIVLPSPRSQWNETGTARTSTGTPSTSVASDCISSSVWSTLTMCTGSQPSSGPALATSGSTGIAWKSLNDTVITTGSAASPPPASGVPPRALQSNPSSSSLD